MIELTEILSLAGQGIGTLSGAADLTEKLKNLVAKSGDTDRIAAQQTVSEIYEKLIKAQRDQLQIERALTKLQGILEERDRFTQQAARYALAETDMGGRVYALKPDDTSGEPHHEICATCFDAGKKSILQPSVETRNTLLCHRCGSAVLKSDGRGSGIMVSHARTRWRDF